MKHIIWQGGQYITTSDSINLEQLNSKQDKLISGINIATVNKQDLTKGGNVEIVGTGDVGKIDNTPEATKHGEIFNDYINNQATGEHSHVEGENNIASGDQGSHAEGDSNEAIGYQGSHAEGYKTRAGGASSHTEGIGTMTTNIAEHAQGIYNYSNHGNSKDTQTIHSIGIGADNARKNAVEVMNNGDVYIKGIGQYLGNNISTDKKTRNTQILTLQEVIVDLIKRIETLEQLPSVPVGVASELMN